MGTGSKLNKGPRTYYILKEEDDDIERKASVLLPVLEDIEKVFHDLVASGDVAATKNFLNNHQDFNINCVNYQVNLLISLFTKKLYI